MQKAIIFGADQFAEILYYFLQQENKIEIVGFTVDSKYRNNDYFQGLPLVDFENVEQIYPPTEYGIYICVGYTNMNSVREQKYNEAIIKGYTILSYIHPTAVINSEVVGGGLIVMENVTIGAKCEIGKGNVFWANAHVAHHTKMGDFNFFTISVAVAGNITIGNNCFFGNNCTIKNGINIADKTLIGAGCYLDRNTNPYDVYVPARSVCLDDKKSTDFSLKSANHS